MKHYYDVIFVVAVKSSSSASRLSLNGRTNGGKIKIQNLTIRVYTFNSADVIPSAVLLSGNSGVSMYSEVKLPRTL